MLLMETAEKPTLAKVIGVNVRRVRETYGWHQDETAVRARDWGLDWTRQVVSAVEAGARRVSIEELVLLSRVLHTTPADLLAGVGEVQLTEGATASLDAFRHALASDQSKSFAKGFHVPMPKATAPATNRKWERWWPELLNQDDGGAGLLLDARRAAHLEAERVAGRKFKVEPMDIAVAAYGLWGQSLTAERDARVAAEEYDAGLRSIQAVRGHVTRKLLAELGQVIKETPTQAAHRREESEALASQARAAARPKVPGPAKWTAKSTTRTTQKGR
jgi:transcriptional regulator with XRE-family HTH domain